MRRPVLAIVMSAALSALGAIILGEYALVGITPLVAGPLFGIAIAETAATVARRFDGYLLVAVALLVEGGLVWATWISTSHRLGDASLTAWLGGALGAGVALLWLRSAGRRGDRTPVDVARAPGDPSPQ